MFITFSWPRTQSHDQSAEVLSGQVSSKVGLTILPTNSVEELKDCEVLLLQTDGFCSRFRLFYTFTAPYWQKVEETVTILKDEFGVDARILINGNQTVLQYAAQEEARARYLRHTLEMTRVAVKATQRWFKDKRIASIRQDIDRCFDEEKNAVAWLSFPVSVTSSD